MESEHSCTAALRTALDKAGKVLLSLSLCLSEGQTPPSLPFGPISLDSRGPLTVTEDEAFHRSFEALCIPSPFTMARAPLQPPPGTRYKGWGRCLRPSTRQLPRAPSTPGLLENHFRSYKDDEVSCRVPLVTSRLHL